MTTVRRTLAAFLAVATLGFAAAPLAQASVTRGNAAPAFNICDYVWLPGCPVSA